MVFRRKHSPRDKKDVTAFNGKEINGARESDGIPVHVLSAFSTEYGISFRQQILSEKSNEIPAIQELVCESDIKDTVVTANALNFQWETCRAILDGGGDYFLFVKNNQKSHLGAVRKVVDRAIAHPARTTKRSVCAIPGTAGIFAAPA